MMSESESRISRRTFVAGLFATGAAVWIDTAIPRSAAARPVAESRPSSLAEGERQLIEAVTARIIPTDDSPGAVEAGCVDYIDRALGEEDAAALPLYRIAIAELDRVSHERFGTPFATAKPDEQDRLLSELESGSVAGWHSTEAAPSAFFETVRIHTILGFVLDPRYGGNRDYVGWKTMGFPGPVHHLGGSQPDQMLGEREFVPIWERTGRKRGRGHGAP